jgi:predicted metal-dependent peptidase
MDETEIAIAISEAYHLAKAYKLPFYLIQADADISSVERITGKLQLEKLEIKGGGGTDSRPVFEYIKKHKIPVDLFIGATDLYNAYPEKKPPYKVIWLTTTTEKQMDPPFGEVLRIQKREKRR